MFKEKLKTNLHGYFQKIEEEGRLLRSSCEARITIVSKPDRQWRREVDCEPVLLPNMDAKTQKLSANGSRCCTTYYTSKCCLLNQGTLNAVIKKSVISRRVNEPTEIKKSQYVKQERQNIFRNSTPLPDKSCQTGRRRARTLLSIGESHIRLCVISRASERRWDL